MSLSLQLFAGARQRHIPHGKFPSVSINDNKTVVEVYQPSIASNTIFYKVGKLKGRGHEMDMCEPQLRLCAGRYPKVAVNNANCVVEVHEGDGYRYVYYRLGVVNEETQRIEWANQGEHQDLCWGSLPAVAIYENRVVITCDYPYCGSTTYYNVGTIQQEEGRIEWIKRDGKLFESYFVCQSSVAINQDFIVAACRGVFNHKVKLGIGRIRENGHVDNWQEICIEQNPHGYSPSICLQNNGYILMVWQTRLFRRLKYITGIIKDRPNDPLTVEWSDNGVYDVGYNPTAAISPREGYVIVEHETNFSAFFRCQLYYKAGTLIRVDRPNEQVQVNNRQRADEQQQANEREGADEHDLQLEQPVQANAQQDAGADGPMRQMLHMHEQGRHQLENVGQVEDENNL